MDDANNVNFELRFRPSFRGSRSSKALLFVVGLVIIVGIRVCAVTVSVSEFTFVGDADDQIRADFVLLNDDTGAVQLEIETVDWDRALDGVTRFYEPGTLERSCASWISLSQQASTLAPNAEIEIQFVIHVPEGVRGTYWAGVLINVSVVRETSEQGDIRLLRQFLVRVFVTISPTNQRGSVSDLQVHGVNPLGIEVSFSNTGDTLLADVSGLIAVEFSTGVSLFVIPLVPFDVLPGYTVRQFVLGDWGLHTAGSYLIRAVLDFGAEYLVAGQSVIRIDELRLVPIGTGELSPTDPDGDGLYDDVDGNGILTITDVNLLRDFLNSRPIQDNARAFDFDNDGGVTTADVDVLRNIVLRTID